MCVHVCLHVYACIFVYVCIHVSNIFDEHSVLSRYSTPSPVYPQHPPPQHPPSPPPTPHTGAVASNVLGSYCRSVGIPSLFVVVCGLLIGQVAFVGSEYWLVTWSVQDPVTQQELKWVWGYSIFIAVIIVASFTRAFVFYGSTLRAATRINIRMVCGWGGGDIITDFYICILLCSHDRCFHHCSHHCSHAYI